MCHRIPDTGMGTVRAWAFILFNDIGRLTERWTFRFGHKVVAVQDTVNCENMRGEATLANRGGTINGTCENLGDLD